MHPFAAQSTNPHFFEHQRSRDSPKNMILLCHDSVPRFSLFPPLKICVHPCAEWKLVGEPCRTACQTEIYSTQSSEEPKPGGTLGLELAVDILHCGREFMPDETGHLPDRPGGDTQSALESAACQLRASPAP